jgi:hypothetical protein
MGSGANEITVSGTSSNSAMMAVAEFSGVFLTVDLHAVDSSLVTPTSASSLVFTGIGVSGATAIASQHPLALITSANNGQDSVGLAYAFISPAAGCSIAFSVNGNPFTTLTAVFEAQQADALDLGQFAAEIIELPVPDSRVGQVAIETVSGTPQTPQFIPTEGVNVGQFIAEILEHPTPNPRVGQVATETVTGTPQIPQFIPTEGVNVGQIAFEFIELPPCKAYIGQLVSEMVASPVAKLRLSQFVVEVIDPTLGPGQSVPAITWATPAPVAPNTPLSSLQLNATSPVAGQLIYTPPLGTSYSQVGTYTLAVLLVPADQIHYLTATATVNLVVAVPVVPPQPPQQSVLVQNAVVSGNDSTSLNLKFLNETKTGNLLVALAVVYTIPAVGAPGNPASLYDGVNTWVLRQVAKGADNAPRTPGFGQLCLLDAVNAQSISSVSAVTAGAGTTLKALYLYEFSGMGINLTSERGINSFDVVLNDVAKGSLVVGGCLSLFNPISGANSPATGLNSGWLSGTRFGFGDGYYTMSSSSRVNNISWGGIPSATNPAAVQSVAGVYKALPARKRGFGRAYGLLFAS